MVTCNIANWFDIPVEDLERAMRFYAEVIAEPLQQYSAPGLEGALFPDRGVTGTLLKGDSFIPGKDGSVVYLDEAVQKKMAECGENFSRADLIQAVKDGARLRLRPKVMTVATIVASLLPILWSTRTGAEVMKPLATPVIGGMISSLLAILIVTPVIFCWLREKEINSKTLNQ